MYIFKTKVIKTAKKIFLIISLFLCLCENNFDIKREVANNTIKFGDANNIIYDVENNMHEIINVLKLYRLCN